jgi:hypothetical protein
LCEQALVVDAALLAELADGLDELEELIAQLAFNTNWATVTRL